MTHQTCLPFLDLWTTLPLWQITMMLVDLPWLLLSLAYCWCFSAVVFRSPHLTFSEILKTYKPSTFFIIETNDFSDPTSVGSEIDQAVYQLFMCGKLLQ